MIAKKEFWRGMGGRVTILIFFAPILYLLDILLTKHWEFFQNNPKTYYFVGYFSAVIFYEWFFSAFFKDPKGE